jgi:hypothetical protein
MIDTRTHSRRRRLLALCAVLCACALSATTPHTAHSQQRMPLEGSPVDGWLEELASARRFVASAWLRGSVGGRLDPARTDQVGMEGVISARLKGGLDDYTFLRLRAELMVPLMFALAEEPTRTDQWWQGIHSLWAQAGMGGIDTTGFDVFLDGRFLHTQEASSMGLSFAYGPTDLSEVVVGLTGRARFGRWAQAEGDARWHPGLPIHYQVKRQAYGSDLPLDVRLTHEVGVALDARSVGNGHRTGHVEVGAVSLARTEVTPSIRGTALGFNAVSTIDQLDAKLIDADVFWRSPSRAQVWHLRASAGWRWLWNRDSDAVVSRYTLRVGGQVIEPDLYSLGLFFRVLEPETALDPRAFYNGSRVELTARSEPLLTGIGLQTRVAFDQACGDDAWICVAGDALRLTTQTEGFGRMWGGEGGVFYRAHRDARDMATVDWTLRSDPGAQWAHEVGVFWRMTLAYTPHPLLTQN